MSNYYELPEGYVSRTAPGRWDGHRSGRLYQWHVYQYAVEVCKTYKLDTVLDVGCGDGDKVHLLKAAGLNVIGIAEAVTDVPNTRRDNFNQIVAANLAEHFWEIYMPPLPVSTLVLCSDVIEHLVVPYPLLRGINNFGRRTLFSTPARECLYPPDHLGPPLNTLHIREWTADEFKRLVVPYFDVVYQKILPQYYDPRRDQKGPRGTQIAECVPLPFPA